MTKVPVFEPRRLIKARFEAKSILTVHSVRNHYLHEAIELGANRRELLELKKALDKMVKAYTDSIVNTKPFV